MSELADPISPTDTVLAVRRTGLIAFLLGILRPNQARAAAVTTDGLKLIFATETATIAFRALEEITIETRRRRSRMHIRHASGENDDIRPRPEQGQGIRCHPGNQEGGLVAQGACPAGRRDPVRPWSSSTSEGSACIRDKKRRF